MSRRVLIAGLLAGAMSVAAVAAPVKVNIAWEYVDFAGKMTIYELKGRPRLWEMKRVKELASAPVGKEIADSSFVLDPGESKRFVLVVKNDTDKTQYFFAAPHVAHPVEHSLGFKFKCLCTDHAYEVGPHETWYRVVEFRLSDGFVAKELTLTHAVIGIDKKRAAAFERDESQSEP